FDEGYLDTINLTWADTERGRGPGGTAVRTGQVSICRNMLVDPQFRPWRDEASRRGYASSIVFPMLADGKAFGSLSIYSRDPDPFSDAEVKLLTELTNDLTYGVRVLRLRAAHAQAEQALQESEERYRQLFSAMTEGFALHEIITDEKGEPSDYRFLDLNPSFERMTGLRRSDVVGRRRSEVLPDDAPHLLPIFGNVAVTGAATRLEHYSPRLGRWFEEFVYCPAPRQFAVVFLDITERKRSEEEREQLLQREQAARAEAESAVRIRDQFISLASHELKTPLTSLKGYAELLLLEQAKTGLSEAAARMVRTIHQQTLRLEKMISALLDITRVERGQLSLERHPVDVQAVLVRIVGDTQPALRRHRMEFAPCEQALMVDGDETRLEQVLQNLIQNAIKYSPFGGRISVETSRDADRAYISISDQGIGIPASALPNLFTRFYRAENAEANRISGLGVGLYVAREIVRLHGGDISATSELGKGSRFMISLPLLRAPDPNPAP
ncbi:MAG: ATP-binding protein, partial [Rudaea sp.]